jgi:hypothetical protein
MATRSIKLNVLPKLNNIEIFLQLPASLEFDKPFEKTFQKM